MKIKLLSVWYMDVEGTMTGFALGPQMTAYLALYALDTLLDPGGK